MSHPVSLERRSERTAMDLPERTAMERRRWEEEAGEGRGAAATRRRR
jgi:hypothetical protein